MKKDKNKEIKMLNNICFWLINQCVDTNATTMKVTQENVTIEDKNVGSWEIKVTKLKIKKVK